jgi:hypothetical protein
MNINPRKETKSHTKNNGYSKEKAKLFQEPKLERVAPILKRIEDLEDEYFDLKIKKIGDLEQEIFELKTRIYLVNNSQKYLWFCIIMLTLPISWDISVKIVKLFA